MLIDMRRKSPLEGCDSFFGIKYSIFKMLLHMKQLYFALNNMYLDKA